MTFLRFLFPDPDSDEWSEDDFDNVSILDIPDFDTSDATMNGVRTFMSELWWRDSWNVSLEDTSIDNMDSVVPVVEELLQGGDLQKRYTSKGQRRNVVAYWFSQRSDQR